MRSTTYLIHRGLFQRARLLYFRRLLDRCGLDEKSRLLDYGCGAGDLLEVCRQHGIEAVGTDVASPSARLTRARGLRVTIADYRSLPHPRGFFDAIVLQSVIEHTREPLELLRSLVPHLKRRGLLVVSAPTPESGFWDDPTHVRPYTPRSFVTLAELCGLEVVEIRYVFSVLLGLHLRAAWIYKLLNLLPFPVGTNLVGLFRVP